MNELFREMSKPVYLFLKKWQFYGLGVTYIFLIYKIRIPLFFTPMGIFLGINVGDSTNSIIFKQTNLHKNATSPNSNFKFQK